MLNELYQKHAAAGILSYEDCLVLQIIDLAGTVRAANDLLNDINYYVRKPEFRHIRIKHYFENYIEK